MSVEKCCIAALLLDDMLVNGGENRGVFFPQGGLCLLITEDLNVSLFPLCFINVEIQGHHCRGKMKLVTVQLDHSTCTGYYCYSSFIKSTTIYLYMAIWLKEMLIIILFYMFYYVIL